MVSLTPQEFEREVVAALDILPTELTALMNNVIVVTEDCHLSEDDPEGVFTATEVDKFVRAAHPPRGQRLAELGIVDAYRKASREPPEGCV